MKRKVVLALVATLTLTVGSLGTVFAMNDSQGITIQISESGNHEHVWGAEEWVVDKEAVYEEQWVIDTPAWTETIEHPAEYEDQWIVDVPAYDQPVYENHTICYTCREQGLGNVIIDGQAGAHQIMHAEKGETCHYGTETIQVDTIHHPEEGHWEKVLIKDSWTETIEHPEEGHYEDVLVSPEEGHWEHTCTDCGEVQNSETGEVITPGNPTDPEKPTDPEEPTDPEVPTDPEEPTNPEKPGTDDPTTEEPETPDNTQDADENKEQQDNDKTTTTDTTDKSENADTATTAVSNENKAPQTGDTASLIYLATLAGSAVTGGTTFGLRRKFKK